MLDVQHTWTFEDLERLPEADPRSYEIVDGALVVSPAPGVDHEFVCTYLRDAVRSAVPATYAVTGPLNLDLHPSYRIPDLCVVSRTLFGQRRKLVTSEDLLLVVEVVSPGSVTTDRITKPAQYAAAGIPAYWRVETEPSVSLTAYTLPTGASVYAELGTWGAG